MRPLIDRIREQHTRHRALVKQLLETRGDSDERRELWRAFCKEVEADVAEDFGDRKIAELQNA